MIYPAAIAGKFRLSRVCKKCGAKIVGTDSTNLHLNIVAHMELHGHEPAARLVDGAAAS